MIKPKPKSSAKGEKTACIMRDVYRVILLEFPCLDIGFRSSSLQSEYVQLLWVNAILACLDLDVGTTLEFGMMSADIRSAKIGPLSSKCRMLASILEITVANC